MSCEFLAKLANGQTDSFFFHFHITTAAAAAAFQKPTSSDMVLWLQRQRRFQVQRYRMKTQTTDHEICGWHAITLFAVYSPRWENNWIQTGSVNDIQCGWKLQHDTTRNEVSAATATTHPSHPPPRHQTSNAKLYNKLYNKLNESSQWRVVDGTYQ